MEAIISSFRAIRAHSKKYNVGKIVVIGGTAVYILYVLASIDRIVKNIKDAILASKELI